MTDSEYEQTRLLLVLRYGSLANAAQKYLGLPQDPWTYNDLKVLGDYVHGRLWEEPSNDRN